LAAAVAPGGGVLEGTRVNLIPRSRPDPAAWRRWLADPEARRFLGRGPWLADGDVVFAIQCRATGRVVGEVGLTDLESGSSAELVVLIGEPAWRGIGLGRDAVRLAVGFAFTVLSVDEVILRVMPDNIRAVRCYEHCGFTREGWLAPRRGPPRRPAVLLMSRRAG
jgi:RimJ/RimL family protein N-acetyltransferase